MLVLCTKVMIIQPEKNLSYAHRLIYPKLIPVISKVSVSGTVEIYHEDDEDEEASYAEFNLTLPSHAYYTTIKSKAEDRNIGLAPVEVDNHYDDLLEIIFQTTSF